MLVNPLVFFDYLSISQIAKSKFFYFSLGTSLFIAFERENVNTILI